MLRSLMQRRAAVTTSTSDTNAPARRAPPPNSLANLRPWKKGQSGNPRGPLKRPSREKLARKARRHTDEMVAVMYSIAMSAPDAETRLRAAKALLAEGWGTVPTSQEVLRPEAPSVTVNVGALAGMSTHDSYKLMVENPGLGADDQAQLVEYIRGRSSPSQTIDVAPSAPAPIPEPPEHSTSQRPANDVTAHGQEDGE